MVQELKQLIVAQWMLKIQLNLNRKPQNFTLVLSTPVRRLALVCRNTVAASPIYPQQGNFSVSGVEHRVSEHGTSLC